MADESSSEKSEKPTEYKLRDAKKKGMVWKSPEAGAAMSVALLAIWMYSAGSESVVSLTDTAREPLDVLVGGPLVLKSMAGVMGTALVSVIELVLPFACLMLAAGVITTLFQTGLIFSTHSLKPDPKRLNPVQGFKKLFSIRTIYETIRSLLKVGILGAVCFHFIWSQYDHLQKMAFMQPSVVAADFCNMGASLLFRLLGVLMLFVVIDLLFQRAQYMKQMRMSKQDVKDEAKRREGDPLIRSKRRKLQQELRQKAGQRGALPGADVIITNPEHYSVAIKFDRESMQVPIVTAKGTDRSALEMQRLARRLGIPIIRNPALARELYKATAIGQQVHPGSFLRVAEALVRAYKIKAGSSSAAIGAAV